MESDRIKSWPVNERPREKLLAEGPEKRTAADLLAIILRVGRGTFKKGVPGQNAQAFARTLLRQFGDLHGLDRATIAELLKVSGLSKAKVAQIKAAEEVQGNSRLWHSEDWTYPERHLTIFFKTKKTRASS